MFQSMCVIQYLGITAAAAVVVVVVVVLMMMVSYTFFLSRLILAPKIRLPKSIDG